MTNSELRESFGYILSRKNHFAKFQFNNIILTHIGFVLVLILAFPFPLLFSLFLDNKVNKLKLLKTITIVRTYNTLKIAELLKIHNDFDILSLSVKGDNYFSKFHLIISLLSDYNIYLNYFYVIKDPFLRLNLIRVLKVTGFSNLEKKIISTHKFHKIIQFNDHSPESLYMVKLCEENRVTSVYVQHAPVSSEFPALYHNENYLFSEDSFNKYSIVHDRIKTHIRFDIRFLKGLNYKGVEKNKNKILLCPNLLDDILVVQSTAYELIKLKFEVVIRMHPADSRKLNKDLHQSSNIDVWKDLATSNIVVTNESAIPLEAIFLDCLIYKASFWGENNDAYNFLSHKLILKDLHNNESLLKSIYNNEILFDRQKLSYYIGEVTFNSKFMINE
ncbi:hypothetical protein FNJ87_18340 [Nonlabens mediterrranea]|uniref:Uncharacterized protein n=1 Tax=Nonlabens mediterrranea TaxID=1419947 RepID=A0ABS0A9W6_9FLAO|nr:hypothetical protein [Nonlabens mediterrranea]